MNGRISRREFFSIGGATAVTALAGCSSDTSEEDPSGTAPVDDGDRPSRGDESAPVTVIVFEDFACPACRQFKLGVAPQIVQQYVEPGDVRYLHADFPIPVDERWSYAVSSAAHAVFEEAGNDAFWEFSSTIYEHQGSYSLDVIESVADEIAAIGPDVRTAADEERYRDRAEADRERGIEWGVSGTPAVFVNGEQAPLDGIHDAIDGQL